MATKQRIAEMDVLKAGQYRFGGGSFTKYDIVIRTYENGHKTVQIDHNSPEYPLITVERTGPVEDSTMTYGEVHYLDPSGAQRRHDCYFHPITPA